MSRRTEFAFAALLAFCIVRPGSAADPKPVKEAPSTGIGRPATPSEIKAWDIDVRPDFKGLPKGSGSVAKGQEIWEGKCASCHGTFGESNEVFAPIVGGTTKDDVRTGHVAALAKNSVPQRTTLMKVSTVSTLWDYIHRAMPWNAPKSLSADDVYAVLAYILNLGDIVPSDYTLSDRNIADVQALMPNRNGMTTDHGLWDVRGKPDVKSVACMKDCPVSATPASALPAAAKGVNGNPADQMRPFGEAVGVDLAAATPAASAAPASAGATAKAAVDGMALLDASGCMACHGVSNKIVGPAFTAVRDKYAGRADARTYLVGKIRSGGSGVWGPVPMPPQPHVGDADVDSIAQWILRNAK